MNERVPSARDGWRRPLVTLLGLILLAASIAAGASMGPAIQADASVTMAMRSETVIDSRAADRHLPPASLTKLMTAYLVFEAIDAGHIDANDRVRVNEHEWRMSGSQMFLEVDERVTIDKLLQGMIVAGGNDAAHALARHLGPGVPQFVARMNRKARALGMDDTHFVNPSGLPASTQRTSAQDLAILARAIVHEFPEQQGRFTDRKITHNGITQRNRNPLLGMVQGVNGLLTGYSESHGYNLAASAQRENLWLVNIILGANNEGDRLLGAAAALRYGFANFETVRLRSADEPVDQVQVWKGQSDFVPAVLGDPLYVTISSDQMESLDAQAEFPNTLVAPLAKGERIGSLAIRTEAGLVTREPLLAGHPVAAAGWFGYTIDTIHLRWDRFWREQREKLFAGEPRDGAQEPSG